MLQPRVSLDRFAANEWRRYSSDLRHDRLHGILGQESCLRMFFRRGWRPRYG